MRQNCTFSIIKIIIHTLILGAIACFSHYAYELSGENIIVGMFNPVNESIWEHLKFMFFPFLLWWIIIFILKNKRCKIGLNTWILSAAASLVIAPLLVVFLYYSVSGALGIESMVFDIILVFLCYFIAFCIGIHLLKYSRPNKLIMIISAIIIVLIFISFILFTFNPPILPIF